MSFVDDFVAQIISLEVSLYHSRARLQANSDSEALHDLRIAVRKIRSLLRPLRNMPEVVELNQAAAEVGRATTPTRDLEVIVDELRKMGYPRQAMSRAEPSRNTRRKLSEDCRQLSIQQIVWRAGSMDRVVQGRREGRRSCPYQKTHSESPEEKNQPTDRRASGQAF